MENCNPDIQHEVLQIHHFLEHFFWNKIVPKFNAMSIY
jgi:hypothetical protein